LTSDNFHHKISSPGETGSARILKIAAHAKYSGYSCIPGVELFCNASISRVAVQKIKKFHKNNGF
jgi:hypothetical protein